MCMRQLSWGSWWLIADGCRGMIRVVAYEGQIVAALACPLIESSLNICSSADLKENGFLVWSINASGCGEGGERVQYI